MKTKIKVVPFKLENSCLSYLLLASLQTKILVHELFTFVVFIILSRVHGSGFLFLFFPKVRLLPWSILERCITKLKLDRIQPFSRFSVNVQISRADWITAQNVLLPAFGDETCSARRVHARNGDLTSVIYCTGNSFHWLLFSGCAINHFWH